MTSRRSGTKRKNNIVNFSSHNMMTRKKSREQGEKIEQYKHETHPLKIENIVEKILSYLDVDSIKNAREVSKLWSAEGAKVLIIKSFLRLPSTILMTEFEAFLSYRRNAVSVISKITIGTTGDFVLWKNLGVTEQQVSSLKLDIDEKIVTREERLPWIPLPNLMDLLPNLKYLSFQEVNSLPQSKKLIAIKVINFIMSKVARNRILHILSPIRIICQSEEDLAEIIKFSNWSSITVKELKVEMWPYHFNNLGHLFGFKNHILSSFRRLLSTNQKTLERLTLQQCEAYLSNLEFSCMTALTHLDLNFSPETTDDMIGCKFPLTFRFSEKIPNLEHISIHYDDIHPAPKVREFLISPFKTTGSSSSVKSIKYSDSCLEFPIDALLKTFPNVKNFQTTDIKCSQKFFLSIWEHGKSIQNLDLNISWYSLVGNFADFDSIFTGIAQETVNKIKTLPEWPTFGLARFAKLKVNPSITELKDLKHLSINFHGNGLKLLPDRMLAFADEYAFKLMPQKPRISIHVKDYGPGLKCAREALDQVSKLSNVSVKFEETQW